MIYPENVNAGENIMASWGDAVRSTTVPRFGSLQDATSFMSGPHKPLDPIGFMVVVNEVVYLWSGSEFNPVGGDKALADHTHNYAPSNHDHVHNHNSAYAAKNHEHTQANLLPTPTRVYDRRTTIKGSDGNGGTWYTISIDGNNTGKVGGVPLTQDGKKAAAVFAQITIIGPVKSGYVKLRPKGGTWDEVSYLNFQESIYRTVRAPVMTSLGDHYNGWYVDYIENNSQNVLSNMVICPMNSNFDAEYGCQIGGSSGDALGGFVMDVLGIIF